MLSHEPVGEKRTRFSTEPDANVCLIQKTKKLVRIFVIDIRITENSIINHSNLANNSDVLCSVRNLPCKQRRGSKDRDEGFK